MTIRDRTDADLPGAVRALHAVHLASGYPTAWPADPVGWLSPAGVRRSWVSVEDGAVMGGVSAVSGSTDPGLAAATGVSGEDLVLLSRLFVAPAGRRRGLASALVQTVVDDANRAGRRAGLDVIESSSDAIALYESMGWTYCGSARAAWRTQRGEHPMIRYYLAPVGPAAPN